MPTWITKKLIGYALAGLLALILSGWLYTAVKNHFIDAANTKQTLANEIIKRNRAEVSLAAMVETIALKEKHLADLVAIRDEAQQKIDLIRIKAEKDKEVLLDRERLDRVIAAKPQLVENLSNKATERVFQNLADIYND